MSRHNNYYEEFYNPSRPIRTDEGLRTRSRKGKIGQSWWAERWIEAIEGLLDPGRLHRGRSYARAGQVLAVEEAGGGITARVQGSQPRPYRVTLRLQPLSDAQWAAAVEQMAGQASFAAQLLNGEMPPDIEEAFASAGVSLFPGQPGDLTTDCSCPDMANPCKHVAATHYILAEQFDEDPFLLFRLRGRGQEQILSALRVLRAPGAGGDLLAESGADYQAQAEPAAPLLEEQLASFWQPADSLASLAIAVKPPAVEMPLLKRLGPPGFLPDHDLAEILAPAYAAITQAALAAAAADRPAAGEAEPEAGA
jgi:uncharacterized Zn finger protein